MSVATSGKVARSLTVPRLALRPPEAARALAVSEDFFTEHVADDLRWVRRGRLKLVAVSELERWLDRNSARVLEQRQ